ncbi:hypothetical protein O9X98_05785 [Agrobacterium salinitolerans]|nr:hypothetical protein [Agrobacterium salinitolerans]
MNNRKLKKINRLRYALVGARFLVGLVMVVPYLASIAIAILGFLGNDPEWMLYGVGGYAITSLVSAVIDFVHDRASKGFEATRLRHYTGRSWQLPNGRLGHFTEVSYTGAEVRLCDDDGRNEWYSMKKLNRIQPTAVRRSDDELKRFAEQARKKIVTLGIKAGCVVAAWVVASLAHDVFFSFAKSAEAVEIGGYLTHAGWLFMALTAYFAAPAVRELIALQGALEETYEGKNWTTPESSVGQCVGVWPYPETLTLKFSNGVTRDYERDQLALAA